MRNLIGHVCIDSNIHVCGFLGESRILIQTKAGDIVRKLRMYTSKKGVYFTVEGKRVYLKYLKSL